MPQNPTFDDELTGLPIDEVLPWEQQPGEPDKWFARFVIYRELGRARNLLLAFNTERATRGLHKMSTATTHWKEARDKYGWIKRAQAYDRHLDRIKEDADRAARRKDAAQWAERKRAAREERITLAMGFRGVVIEALKKEHKRIEAGVSQTNITGLVAAFATINRELRADFDDEPTQRHAVDLPDPTTLTDEELAEALEALAGKK